MVKFFKTTPEENEPKQKYVDLLSNSGFKAVFGDRTMMCSRYILSG